MIWYKIRQREGGAREMEMKPDRGMIALLITDDEAVDLVKPTNGAELGAIAAHDGRVPPISFRYDHAADTARAWAERVQKLEQSVQSLFGGDSVHDQLWQEELERQARLVDLARGISRGDGLLVQDSYRYLYGQPTENWYFEAVAEMRGDALLHTSHEDALVRELATGVAERLPDHGTVEPTPLPTAETVAALKGWVDPIVSPWLAVVDALGAAKTDKLNAEAIAGVYAVILAPYGLRAEVTDEVNSISFRASKGAMGIPPDRKMTPGLLKGNVAHEGMHVRRHIGGRDLLLALGEYGLPGYLPFEEGVASAVQSVATSSDPTVESYARPEAYYAIGQAAGLGGQHLTANELYGTLSLWYALEEALKQAKKGAAVDREPVELEGHKKAWGRVVRTLRGTCGPGQLGGFCPRDLSYRDGNYALWTWVAQNADRLDLLARAKADLTRPLHLGYLLQG